MEYLLTFINETALEKIVEEERSQDKEFEGLLEEIKMTRYSELALNENSHEEKTIDYYPSKNYNRRRNLSTGVDFIKTNQIVLN